MFADFSVYEWLNNLKILLHEKLSENGIVLEISVNTQARTIKGDVKLLTQVLINIINNAMEAMATIDTGNRKIRVEAEPNDKKQTLIIISNNGPAIPPDLLDKIFVPFFTTKETGSGIGLSLSRQIIQMHHGYIYVESGEERTSFIVVL